MGKAPAKPAGSHPSSPLGLSTLTEHPPGGRQRKPGRENSLSGAWRWTALHRTAQPREWRPNAPRSALPTCGHPGAALPSRAPHPAPSAQPPLP